MEIKNVSVLIQCLIGRYGNNSVNLVIIQFNSLFTLFCICKPQEVHSWKFNNLHSDEINQQQKVNKHNLVKNIAGKYEPQHDKTNKVTVRPAKTPISLGIRTV